MFTKTTLDPKKVMRAMHKLRAINHPIRLLILEYLDQKGVATVGKIAWRIGEHQPVASQHLAILRKEGLVDYEVENKFYLYHINYKELERLMPIIKELASLYTERPSEKREYDNSFRTMRHYS